MCIRDSALVDTKVQLVGIDAMSIAADFDEAVTHIKLLQNGIYTVSYTHLDVYKRQSLEEPVRASKLSS